MKHSYARLITLLFIGSTAYAMEIVSESFPVSQTCSQLPINPTIFTEKSKDYMKYCINLWNKSAQEGKIDQNTGLAAVWSNLGKESIDSIIYNQPGLAQANGLLADLTSSPVYTALPGIAAIGQLNNLTAAPDLAAQVARVAIQATLLSRIKTIFPQFNDIDSDDHLNAFALIGTESIPYNIKFLQNNTLLDTKGFMPLGTGMLLLIAYLNQQNS